MRNFSASFVGMVKAGDSIEVHLDHVAMLDGNKIIKIEARNMASQEKVFVGECEVEPAETAYIFTGQGSQEAGMGMDLYDSSPAARAVWDRADKHFDENYGKLVASIRMYKANTTRLPHLRYRSQEPKVADYPLWRKARCCHPEELSADDIRVCVKDGRKGDEELLQHHLHHAELHIPTPQGPLILDRVRTACAYRH
jgi:hypothetical protein